MKQLKKHAIGYNTVSSKNGVINARGVKSKPNDIQIFGYTHEIGTGKKSPDNPYILKSLDSGNVNLYSKDKIIRNTVGKTTTTGKVTYGIELPHPKTGYYCVKSDPSTEYPLTYNLYDIETNVLAERGWNIAINSNNSDTGRIIKVDDGLGLLLYDCRDNNYNAFTNRTNLMILDSPIMPDEYITDEHSIILSNNKQQLNTPLPIALNGLNIINKDVRDRIIKKEDGYYVEQNIKKFIIDENIKMVYFILQEQTNGIVKFATRFPDMDGKIISTNKIICNKLPSYYENMNFYEHIRNSYADYPNSVILYISISRMTENNTVTEDEVLAYLKDNPIEVLYQVENPYYLKLSDYAQDLLNSFTLQNQNEISVEGNPDFKISGYIQK